MCAAVCPVSHWSRGPDLQQIQIEHNSNCYLTGTVIKASSFPRASRRASCLFSLRSEVRHYLYTPSSASLALPLRPSCPFRFRRCVHPASLVIQPFFCRCQRSMASSGHHQHLFRSATALDSNGLMHHNSGSSTQYDLNVSSSGFVQQQSHAQSQPVPALTLGNGSNVRTSLFTPIDATQPLSRFAQWPNHTGTSWTTSDSNQPASSSLSSLFSSTYASVQPPSGTSSHSLHLPQHPNLAASNNTSSSSSSLAAAFPESSQRTSVITPPTSTELYHPVTSAMHDTTGDGSNNSGFAWSATHDSGITHFASAPGPASQPVSYNNYVQQNNSLLSYDSNDIGAPQSHVYAGGSGGGAAGSYALTGYSSQQDSHNPSSTVLSHHSDPNQHFQSSSSQHSSPGES